MSRIDLDSHAAQRASSRAAAARTPRVTTACRLAAALACAANLAVPQVAQACPSCASGERARSEVFAIHFGLYLLDMALPFLVIGALCLAVDAIGRRGASDGASEDEDDEEERA